MTNENMKRCQIKFFNRDMKSKTRMRQFKTPTRMAKIKILTITYNVNRCEKE